MLKAPQHISGSAMYPTTGLSAVVGGALLIFRSHTLAIYFCLALPTVAGDTGSASYRICQTSRALPLHFQVWASYTCMLP